MKSIDISHHQGNVNMKAVRDSGIERVILRSGYGKNNTDRHYDDYATAMHNLGIKGGTYWFSYALSESDAKKEGKYAVDHARKYWDKCLIAYDWEYDSVNNARKHAINPTKTTETLFAISFLKEVQAAGFIPCIYLNEDYWRNHFDVDTIKRAVPDLRIWYACWYSANSKEIVKQLPEDKAKMVDIWQYSSKGKVPGINGNVDMDEWYNSAELYSDGNSETKPIAIEPNMNIATFQREAGLPETGIDDDYTRSARKGMIFKANYVDGYWKVGSVAPVVGWIQTRLTELGYSVGGVDCKYGAKTRKAVISFQGKNGLTADGIAGYNTLTRLFYV